MSSSQQPPIHLTILRKGDTNIIDLAEVGSLIPRSETQVESRLLQELADEVMNLATPGNGRLSQEPTALDNPENPDTPDTLLQDLKRIGELIFSHLLTEPARNRLRTSEPCNLYLRLDEQLIHVPWELCYDGHDFLATKFRIGRQIITNYAVPGMTATRTLSPPFKVLLIVDPTETLPQAEIEAQQLRSLLEGVEGIELTQLGGKSIRKVPLLSALQHHDIVHFAGHSYYDSNNPTKSGWRLAEDILTAGELSKLNTPPLLVFSNSCQAGATAEWDRPRYEGQAFGIGSAFLLAGVKNYIGTFWVVHDDESARFAAVYYQSMAQGHSLGMALQQARHTALEDYGGHSLTWASYMLYGDPGFPLLPQSANVAEIPALPAGAASAASAASAPSATRSSPSSSSPSSEQDTDQVSRKLAAVLMADVQGYSRLMGEDEEATVRTLTAFRAVFADLIQQHNGRLVDAPGDAVLAEFVSVVDSVRCAVAIQRELARRNASLPPQRRMIFRIGLNLGDIIAQGREIYGDGINIAARLEPLADGGGVCISGTVFDQVETKLEFSYEDLGPQKVKNIARPVRAYKIIFDPAPASAAPQPAVESSQSQSKEHVSTLQSGKQAPAAPAAPATLVKRESTATPTSQRTAAAQQTRTSSGNSTPLIVGAGIVLVLIGLYFWSTSSTPPEQAGQEIASSEQAVTAIETSAVIPLGSLTYSRHLSTPSLTIHLSAPYIEQAFLDEIAVPISEEGVIQYDFQELAPGESTHKLHLVGQSNEQGHDVVLILYYYPNWEIRQFSEGVGQISAMALSPDGSQILSGSRQDMVKLRDTQTGAELRAFTGHTGWVNSVTFSPDGTKILSGSDDTTLKLWDVETGQELQTFSGHTAGVNSVAFSPDGSHILSGGKDKRLRWWNIESGKTEKTFSGHRDWVIHVAVSPDGTQALSSSDDKTLRLWDIQKGRTIQTFSGHTDLVNGVDFSPDGKQALSSSNDKTLKLWDIETGEEVQTFSGHTAGVRTAAFSPDGTTILSSGQDQTIREWWVAPSSHRTVEVQLIEVAQPVEEPQASSPSAP